jgi:hypothetical protein
LNVFSQIFTVDVRKQRPFQKKYFESSLGESASALTTFCGSGTQTGVPVFVCRGTASYL